MIQDVKGLRLFQWSHTVKHINSAPNSYNTLELASNLFCLDFTVLSNLPMKSDIIKLYVDLKLN